MNLSLTDRERTVLATLLDEAYRNLKEEINKTETYEYKDQLKEEEQILLGLIGKVSGGPSA